MNNKISLIMATYGRKDEIRSFLEKLLISNYDLRKIEVIIVDQNEKIDLSEIIKLYIKKINIKHIKSNTKGLSINRNIGIKCATGDIIAFPDDDCEYLEDTLYNVNKLFNEDKNCKCIMGRIIERDGSDSLRSWPKNIVDINKKNFYTKCTSVTMFYRVLGSKVSFNEKLGVGQKFGSCEDTDILYRNLKIKNEIVYNHMVKIYHPHYDSKTNMNIDKVKSYALGFGAFVRSNLDIYTLYLMIKVETFHFLKSIFYLLSFKIEDSKKSYYAFLWRLKGFFSYKS